MISPFEIRNESNLLKPVLSEGEQTLLSETQHDYGQ